MDTNVTMQKTYKQDLKKGGYLKGDNLCNAEKEKGGSKSTQSLGKLNRWRIEPFFILHSRYFPERKKISPHRGLKFESQSRSSTRQLISDYSQNAHMLISYE